MAPQENQRNLFGMFGPLRLDQREVIFAIAQLGGLDRKDLISTQDSIHTLAETYRIAQTIRESSENAPDLPDPVANSIRQGSAKALYTGSGLRIKHIIEALPLPAQNVVTRFLPAVVEVKKNAEYDLSMQVGGVSINDLIEEQFDEPSHQIKYRLGSYFTLFMDLMLADKDSTILERIAQQNQDKHLNPNMLRFAILSSGSLAGVVAFLPDLDESALRGSNKKTREGIKQETHQLFHAMSHLRNEIFTTLSDPQSSQFPSVKESVQPYLLSQDIDTKNRCMGTLIADDMGGFVTLYRTAQEFIARGVEVEFYRYLVRSLEEEAQYRNQKVDKVFILTNQDISGLLENHQPIPSEETPTLDEISVLSQGLSLSQLKQPFSIDPVVVEQSGLSMPRNIQIESRPDNTLVVSFLYQNSDGKLIQFGLQFPIGKENPDPREFRWNVLADPSKEPQLHSVAMRAVKDVIATVKGQIEETQRNQEGVNTTTGQSSAKGSIKRKNIVGQVQSLTRQERRTNPSKDNITGMRQEVKRGIGRLPKDEQENIQDIVQRYNTRGGNLKRLQLLGVRGGPYYGLDTTGGKIIVMQRVGKSSDLQVVAIGTLQEVIRSLGRK